MKLYKTLLHLWITLASFLAFLGGWAMLAHSLKPVQPSQTASASIAPMPTLPAIQFFSDSGGGSGGLNSISPNPQVSSGFPMLRTGGS